MNCIVGNVGFEKEEGEGDISGSAVVCFEAVLRSALQKPASASSGATEGFIIRSALQWGILVKLPFNGFFFWLPGVQWHNTSSTTTTICDKAAYINA